MHRAIRLALAACTLTAAGLAVAEVSADAIGRARLQVLQGNTDAAIQMLQELQVEAPDSPFVHFGLGEAQFKAAEQALETGNLDEALGWLNEALRAFESASLMPNPGLRADAVYNAANTLTRQAEILVEAEQTGPAIEQYLNALAAYDEALALDPGHDGARHNRAYARLRMKEVEMLPPPPPEDQPQQPEGGEEEDEGEDEEEEQQPEGDEEQPDQPEGEEEEQQPEPGDEDESPPERDPGEDAPTPQPPTPQPDDPQPDEPQDMPMQEFEALLDTLENIDEEEQRNLRRDPRAQSMVGEWW